MTAGSLPTRLHARLDARIDARLALGCLATGLALVVAGCGSDSGPTKAADPGPAASPSNAASSGSTSPSTAGSASESASSGDQAAYAVYDVGTTPQGPRLYREFRSTDSTDTATAALDALTSQPADPDYRTLWPSGSFSSATLTDSQIDVVLADSSLADRPTGMSKSEAKLALQQVVYTVQAASGRRLPVQFLVGDAPATTVLGVSTTDPVSAGDELATLALVSVTLPEQGQTVSGSFTASGVASSFEGTVAWTILDNSGKQVQQGSAQTEGDYTSLTPWKATIDTSSLPAGDYTFVASTGDSGEGGGPTEDTKAITIQ